MVRSILFILPALLLSGCFITDMKNDLRGTKAEVQQTNEQVTQTNEKMGRMIDKISTTDARMAELVYKQTTVGLLATINEEKASNIGIAAAQKFLTIVHEDSLRKYLATPMPVDVQWVKEGLSNVSIVGEPTLGAKMDFDPMSEFFYSIFQRASYVTLKELATKAKSTAFTPEEFAEKQETAERAVLVAPILWGAKRLSTEDGRLVLKDIASEEQREKIRGLVLEVTESYHLDEDATESVEISIDVRLATPQSLLLDGFEF